MPVRPAARRREAVPERGDAADVGAEKCDQAGDVDRGGLVVDGRGAVDIANDDDAGEQFAGVERQG